MQGRRRPPPLDAHQAEAFFSERIPAEWFVEPVEITFDDVEILVVGRLPEDGSPEAERDSIGDHRESTREARMAIAAEAEATFGRRVAWGARRGDTGLLFTHLTVPAMTRLRLSQRLVLDTLVDGGVARSRSDALSWCVRMVERNLDEWLEELRAALTHVEEVRRRGPDGM